MLKVQVSGYPGDGKTTLAMLIEGLLKATGVKVINNDPDKVYSTDHPELQAARLKAISDRSLAEHVLIEVVPLRPVLGSQ